MADLLLATNGGTYHAPTEAFLRGHLTRAECDAAINDAMHTTGEPLHTWGRWGFGLDEWGGVTARCLHTGPRYAGQRGAFRVSVVDVSEHAWAWLVVEQIGQGDEGDTLEAGTAPTALEAIEAAGAAVERARGAR